MRGDERSQDGMFSYVSLEQRVPADHPLRAVRKFTDAVLMTLSPEFDALYAASGRPSIAPEYAPATDPPEPARRAAWSGDSLTKSCRSVHLFCEDPPATGYRCDNGIDKRSCNYGCWIDMELLR